MGAYRAEVGHGDTQRHRQHRDVELGIVGQHDTTVRSYTRPAGASAGLSEGRQYRVPVFERNAGGTHPERHE